MTNWNKSQVLKVLIVVGVTVVFVAGASLWSAVSSGQIRIAGLATETSMPSATPTPSLSPTITPTRMPSSTPTPNATQILLASMTPTPDVSFEPTQRTMLDGSSQVWVPPGSYIAGDSFDDGYDDEDLHQVYTDGFWIDQFLVTNSQFVKCPEAVCGRPAELESHMHPEYFGNSSYDNYPVIEITWEQAQTFCEWRGGRLPTEAEWEKAAGWDPETSQMYQYPWGNQSPDETLANYGNDDRDVTPVDRYDRGVSPVGAYDMAGNVWQFVADWYSDTYYTENDDWINPTGPLDGETKIIRGGSWATKTLEKWLRVSNRGTNNPDNPGNEIGFRCVFES